MSTKPQDAPGLQVGRVRGRMCPRRESQGQTGVLGLDKDLGFSSTYERKRWEVWST